MQYFEQVQRGMRAPGRALAPAISAIALCTVALLVTPGPIYAAEGYNGLVLTNHGGAGEDVIIGEVKFMYRGDAAFGGAKLKRRTLADPARGPAGSKVMRGWGFKKGVKHRYQIRWKCKSHTFYNVFETPYITSEQICNTRIDGCEKDAIKGSPSRRPK